MDALDTWFYHSNYHGWYCYLDSEALWLHQEGPEYQWQLRIGLRVPVDDTYVGFVPDLDMGKLLSSGSQPNLKAAKEHAVASWIAYVNKSYKARSSFLLDQDDRKN